MPAEPQRGACVQVPAIRYAPIERMSATDVADLLAWLLCLEADRAETIDQAEYLDELCGRAAELSIGEVA